MNKTNKKNTSKTNVTKMAIIAGAAAVSMLGASTTINAKETNAPVVRASNDSSAKKEDKVLSDVQDAQNSVIEAQKDFNTAEQTMTQQQAVVSSLESNYQDAQTSFNAAVTTSQEMIQGERENLQNQITNAETTIANNETEITKLESQTSELETTIQNTENTIDQKEKELADAQSEAVTISEDEINAAQDQLKASDLELENTTKSIEDTQKLVDQTNEEVDTLKNQTNATQQQVQSAQDTTSVLETEVQQAKEKQETAQTVYDAIVNGTAVDKELMDKAKTDVANAETGLANAEKDLTDTKTSVNNYEASIKNLETEVKNNETALNAEKEKQVQVTNLEKSVSDKQKEVNTKANAVSTAQSKKTEIDNKVSQKTNELNSAKSTKTQKESELTKTQNELATVKDKIANPGKYEVVKDAERQSALGFFKSLGDKGGYSVNVFEKKELTDKWHAPKKEYLSSNFTKLSEKEDASSLENLKKAVSFLKQTNDLRKKEGKTELKVSPTLMAIALMDTNMAAESLDHAHSYGSGGQNAAWGYDDPYVGWYEKEKINYETNNGGQVGHYLNIVSDSYVLMGAGHNLRSVYGSTSIQNFSNYDSYKDAMTVEEFERLFMAYYNANKVETLDVNALKQERSTLEKKISTLQSEIKTLNTTISSTQTEINSLKKEQTAAETDLSKAKDVYNTANSELTSLQNQLKTAKANCDVAKAENTLATSKTKLETAKTNLVNAKKDVTTKTAKVEEAKVTLADAKQALKDLEPDLDRALTNLEDANKVLAEKEEAYAQTKDALTALQTTLKAQQTNLEEKVNLQTSLTKQLEDLKLQQEQAIVKQKDAQIEVDRVLKPRRTIERVTNEIQHLEKEVEKAQSELDACIARIQTLKEENETFRSSLPQLQVALSIVEAYEQSLELAKQGAAYNTDFDSTEAHLGIKQSLDAVSTTYAKKEISKAEYEQSKAMLDTMLPEYTKAKEKLEKANRLLEEKQRLLRGLFQGFEVQIDRGLNGYPGNLDVSDKVNVRINRLNEISSQTRSYDANVPTEWIEIQLGDRTVAMPPIPKPNNKKEKKESQDSKTDEIKKENQDLGFAPVIGGGVIGLSALAFVVKTKKE